MRSWIEMPRSFSPDQGCLIVSCCSNACFVNCTYYNPVCTGNLE